MSTNKGGAFKIIIAPEANNKGGSFKVIPVRQSANEGGAFKTIRIIKAYRGAPRRA